MKSVDFKKLKAKESRYKDPIGEQDIIQGEFKISRPDF